MTLDVLVYRPFTAFILVPPLALLPGAILLLLRRRARARNPSAALRAPLVAAVMWMLYAAYEAAVWVWSQSTMVPIRADLLVIVPVLYLVSLLGVWACWSAARAGSASPPASRGGR